MNVWNHKGGNGRVGQAEGERSDLVKQKPMQENK